MSRAQGANPYNVAQHINGNSHLVNMQRILRIPQVSKIVPVSSIVLEGWGPKKGRKCYVTPAFSGVPNKGDKMSPFFWTPTDTQVPPPNLQSVGLVL